MTENEKKELLESHKPADKEGAKRYEENPPRIIDGLEYQPGEGVVGYLSKEDLIQLGSRYLNDFGVLLRNVVHFQLRCEKVLTFIAEKLGVDVAKEFKNDAAKTAELMEQRLQQSKEELKNFKNKDN